MNAASAAGGPRASLVICAYNRAHQVGACLDSLVASRERDFEIVAVDDASTDDTLAVLHEYRRAHPDIAVTVVENEENRGVSGARNAGILAARGEFVVFTDSDCTVDPEWLGRLLRPFARPEVAAVAGPVDDVSAASYADRVYRGTCRVDPGRGQVRGLVGCNMAFRREPLAEVLFDDAMTYGCDEDDVAWRLEAMGHAVAFAPGARVFHDHPYDLAGYLRLGWRQGLGAARFWYKRGTLLGRDSILLLATLLTLPLAALAGAVWLLLPATLFALHLAALVFNEVAYKGKGALEALWVLPGSLLYSFTKLAGVLAGKARIALGMEPAIVASKRRWSAFLADRQPASSRSSR